MTLELISLETLQTLVTEYGYWSVFIGIGLENMGIPLPGEALTLLGAFLPGVASCNTAGFCVGRSPDHSSAIISATWWESGVGCRCSRK